MLRTPPDSPFVRVRLHYAVQGGTRIAWDLHPSFVDAQPHSFLLEGAYSSVPSDEFEAIGTAADNTFYLIDPEKRIWGQSQDWFYRVRLTTPSGTYTSPPIGAQEHLDYRSYRLVRDLLRKEKLRFRNYVSRQGYLLKRKRYGARCVECTDRFTGEVTDSHCTVCEGTGILAGYFAAVPNYEIDVGLAGRTESMDDVQTSGTIKPVVHSNCRALGEPQLDSYDVFCDRNSGERFFVREIQDAYCVRGYTVMSTVSLTLANFSDRIYAVGLGGS